MRVLAHIDIFKNPTLETEDFVQYLLNKYAPYSQKNDWSGPRVSLFTDQAEFDMLMSEIRGKRLRVNKWYKVVYSEEELNSSEYLVLIPEYAIASTFAGSPELFFTDTCGCNTFISQYEDLAVKKKDIGKKDLVLSWENEYLVSIRLKELLVESCVTGVGFRPVHANTNHEDLVAYQVVTNNMLPNLDSNSNLQKQKTCKDCEFWSYTRPTDQPLYYSKEALVGAMDFNRTIEYFGSGFCPRPLIIVSQRVRQLLLEHKIKGAAFEPIFLAQ